LQCEFEEKIPYKIVRDLDEMDDGNPTYPPRFFCEQCGDAMYPHYYKGIYGFEYRISDVQETKGPR